MSTPAEVLRDAVMPALALLPSQMNSLQARVMLLAIGLQESGLTARRQYGNGPARGLWQFERGTEKSRGGVWGVYLHEASRYWLDHLTAARGVLFQPESIYQALEHDDVLAAGVARLLLFTDPRRLPFSDDPDGGYELYMRTWRPGKPHPKDWPANHKLALEAAL